jgi:hypothetical protein
MVGPSQVTEALGDSSLSHQQCYNPMDATVSDPNILAKVRCKDRKIQIYVFDKIELADKRNEVVLPFSPKVCVNHTLMPAVNHSIGHTFDVQPLQPPKFN